MSGGRGGARGAVTADGQPTRCLTILGQGTSMMLRCLLLLYLSVLAFANTEIANFYASSVAQAPVAVGTEW